MEISVVVPVYGCPEALPELHRRIVKTCEEMNVEFEIVLVDDHDGKGSWEEVEKIAVSDTRVKAIHFAKNFGQDRALAAGITVASGNWIVTMDCDLQDAPENIPLLYNKAVSEKLDVVFVRRQKRKDSAIVQLMSKQYHKMFSYLSELPFDYELGTYLIASSKATDYYKRSSGRGKDYTMFLLWLGLKHDFVELEHETRFAGKSSYTLRKKLKYGIDAIVTFSNRLLYIPLYIGALASVIALAYIIYVLVLYFAGIEQPEGWSTIIAFVCFFGGLLLDTLGIIGIYIGNLLDIAKNKTEYVIQDKINCD